MDRGAWWTMVHGVTKSQLSTSLRSDEDVFTRTAPWKRILLNMEHEIGCVFNHSQNVLPEMPPTGGKITVAPRLFLAKPGGTKIKDSNAPDQHRLQG